MKITHQKTISLDSDFECVVLPFWEGPLEAADFPQWKEALAKPLKSGDFHGKFGETLFLYKESKRLLLLGLGKQDAIHSECIRRAIAAAVRAAHAKKIETLHLVTPYVHGISPQEVLQAMADGLLLTNYNFSSLKHDTIASNPPVLVQQAVFVGDHFESALLKKAELIASGVHQIRDLVNNNADEVNAQKLAEFAESSGLKTKVLGKKEIEREKMGLLLAVNRGAEQEPALIVLSHRGDPSNKEHIVLVGKGVTYDTGGLNVKPADGMLTMKCDMAGAATVLTAVRVAGQLNLKVNVTAVVPAAENAIDGKSYKQGDVYRAKSGKTVEITHTDAEGRLILADAFCYALEHLKPTLMIDLATLTGGVVIALGDEIAGLFCNHDALAKDLLHSSEQTGEEIWRLPLPEDYKEMLKSEIADLVNSAGRSASSITGALFLQEFCGGVPWAHLDIAGTAYQPKPKFYNTSKATGFGLRLLINFLEKRASS